MAGGDHKAGEIPTGDPEGQEGGAVAGDIILPAGDDVPGPALAEADVAPLLQGAAEVGHRVEAAGAGGEEGQQIVHIVSPILFKINQ